MTDYTKLVEALRYCGKKYFAGNECKDCIRFGTGPLCDDKMKLAAADAIEALEKQIDSIENDKTNLEADIINLEIAIDKANTQLPKRGKWIYKPKDAIEMMFTLPKCSVCGHESSDANNYCPNCGADMRKMEAQDDKV